MIAPNLSNAPRLHRSLWRRPPDCRRRERGRRSLMLLRVLAVGAHVPLTDRAVRTRHRVRSADDADDMIADAQSSRTWVDDTAERLVPEHQTLLPRRGPPVVPAAISTSVPQMPTASASTTTDPRPRAGSTTASNRTVPLVPGTTVTDCMTRRCRIIDTGQRRERVDGRACGVKNVSTGLRWSGSVAHPGDLMERPPRGRPRPNRRTRLASPEEPCTPPLQRLTASAPNGTRQSPRPSRLGACPKPPRKVNSTST